MGNQSFYQTFVDIIETNFAEFVAQYEEFSREQGFGGL